MIKKNILQEKKNKLTTLQAKSAQALDVVTNTISSLERINEDICNTIDEIEEAKRDLENTAAGFTTTKNRNERIIERFKAMID